MTSDATASPRLEVAIALVFRGRRLLVTQRPKAAHLGGSWELPGGKLAPGETAEDCAVREVREETAVEVVAKKRLPAIDWDYPERRVRLHPVECEWVRGEGERLEVTGLIWATKADLSTREFPPANVALIDALCRSGRLD